MEEVKKKRVRATLTQVRELQKKLDQKEILYNRLIDKNQDLEVDNRQFRESNKLMEMELKRLREENENLRKDIDHYKAKNEYLLSRSFWERVFNVE